MAGCRPEQGPPTRRGTVSDAGRGGRWAALVAFHNHLYVESLGKLAEGELLHVLPTAAYSEIRKQPDGLQTLDSCPLAERRTRPGPAPMGLASSAYPHIVPI